MALRSFDLTFGLTATWFWFSDDGADVMFDFRISKADLRRDPIGQVELGRWRWFLSVATPPGCGVSDFSKWKAGGYASPLGHVDPIPGCLHLDAELYSLLGELHPVWLFGDRFDDWVESIRSEATRPADLPEQQ